MTERFDVAIVGGGPAGTATAIHLARTGWSTVIIERSREPAWRACGVFTSPATARRLEELGMAPKDVAAVSRAIPAMRVESPRGTTFRLTYGDEDTLRASPLGFDRPGLDRALLALAGRMGAAIRTGVTVTRIETGPRENVLTVRDATGEARITARTIVGADGIRSLLARSVGTARPARLAQRTGLTFHVADPGPDRLRDARMVVLDGAYCGLAPVPDGRVNVGIVLASRNWHESLAQDGAEVTARRILAAIPPADDDPAPWASTTRCDDIYGASPLGHRVTRRAGEGWLLVGDAAGFLDPFTGEGLHRALVSAELGAKAIDAHLSRRLPLGSYERAMAARFTAKDAATVIVQAFLSRPAFFEYACRRLARRGDVRATIGLVMGDLVPASRALDPRFLAALLRP